MSEDKNRGSMDQELEIYRSVLETPKEFKNGFTWVSVAGAFFCGLLMMPGSIYLGLMTGGGIAAAWVTLIIFSEVCRRAMRTLSQQELVILLVVAGAMAAGGPFAGLVWRQYLVQSDAVRDIGLLGKFPAWFSPQPTSDAILHRNFFDAAWLVPVLLILFMTIIGRFKSYTLGYLFFRLTSDVERLPFPFAGVAAQGSMALSESGERKVTWKWKMFSLGAILGIAFGVVQIGIPLVTGSLLTKPIQIIPLPWYDMTTMTQGLLPATPTGLIIDLGLIITGMIIPFWALIGTGAAILLTLIMNPILHHIGVLTRWQPGMDTVATTFANSIDFWMSFTMGVTGAIAAISIFQTGRDLYKKSREMKARRAAAAPNTRRENMWDTPPGRGDFSLWIAGGVYVVSATIVVSCVSAEIPSDVSGLFHLLLYPAHFLHQCPVDWYRRPECGNSIRPRGGVYFIRLQGG